MTNLFEAKKYTSIGYRSSESGQTEIFITYTQLVNSAWETVYTVPAGRTLYVSDVMISWSGAINNARIGTGVGPTAIFYFPGGTTFTQVPFRIVSEKFVSGTVISFRTDAAGTKFTMVGFIE